MHLRNVTSQNVRHGGGAGLSDGLDGAEEGTPSGVARHRHAALHAHFKAPRQAIAAQVQAWREEQLSANYGSPLFGVDHWRGGARARVRRPPRWRRRSARGLACLHGRELARRSRETRPVSLAAAEPRRGRRRRGRRGRRRRSLAPAVVLHAAAAARVGARGLGAKVVDDVLARAVGVEVDGKRGVDAREDRRWDHDPTLHLGCCERGGELIQRSGTAARSEWSSFDDRPRRQCPHLIHGARSI